MGESGIATHNTTCNTGTTESTEVKQSEKYEPTQELRDHIKSGNGQAPKGSKGIDGAHNEVELKKMVEKYGCKITDVTELEPGIKKYDYQVPYKDRTEKIIDGKYKSRIQHKTTYDPEIISDENFIKRGVDAFENYKNGLDINEILPRKWEYTDIKGLKWKGYTDGYGNLTSLFPCE